MRDPDDSLLFTFSAQLPDGVKPLSAVSIPLSYLPLDQQITESFQMDLLTSHSLTPRIFVKLCDHLTSVVNPFGPDIPFGVLTVRERSIPFASGHISQEFSDSGVALQRSGTFPLFSSQNLSSSFNPIVCLEEEEEEEDVDREGNLEVIHQERERKRLEEVPAGLWEDRAFRELNFSFFPNIQETLCFYRQPPPLDLEGDYF
jgi:hypothetical protein